MTKLIELSIEVFIAWIMIFSSFSLLGITLETTVFGLLKQLLALLLIGTACHVKVNFDQRGK